MLGIALLHFLPDANEQLHSLDKTVEWMLGGFLTMFFVQRFFHFHHHDLPEGDPEDCCGHDHEHDHVHLHAEHAHTLADKSAKQLSWVGTALGLTLHSLLDGLALAASVQAGVQGQARSEEHTSELQSPDHLVCRLLLEKKKIHYIKPAQLIAVTTRL